MLPFAERGGGFCCLLFFLFFVLLLSFYASNPIRAPLLLSLDADFDPHLGFKTGVKPQNKSQY